MAAHAAPKRQRPDEQPPPAPTAGPPRLTCDWLPFDAATDTHRTFWVRVDPGGRVCSAELEYEWWIDCEKKIPFCIKQLTGKGRLDRSGSPSAGAATRISVDLSRTGYGTMTLRATTADPTVADAAPAISVREVATELPGRASGLGVITQRCRRLWQATSGIGWRLTPACGLPSAGASSLPTAASATAGSL
jgi:hypothetical protein